MLQEANLQWRYIDTSTNLIYPWYTMDCLEWLKEQDTKEWNVFEYGSGYSSIWWRLNSKSVESIDSDQTWAEAMNVKYIKEKGEYVERVARVNHWDCVIVDGSYRYDCIQYSMIHIKSGGYLIVDNWEQDMTEITPEEVEKVKDLLKDWELTVYKQYNHSSWKTAVFKKP